MKQCPGANKHAEGGSLDRDVKTRVASPRNQNANDVPPFFARVGDTSFVQQLWRKFRQPLLWVREVSFQGTRRPRLFRSTISEMEVIPAISIEDLALEVSRRNLGNRAHLAQIRMVTKGRHPPIDQTANYMKPGHR